MPQDWNRIFPEGDHRWTMGLTRGVTRGDYFRDTDATGAVRAERAHWLNVDPQRYAALLPDAEPALRETVELARQLKCLADRAAYDSPFAMLLALGCAWEPDFVWMHPGDDGRYRVIGGVVCFPSSWALEDKLGRPMSEVHAPVPGLNQTIGRSIDMFLAKQEPGVPWTRENWSLAGDGERNHHTSRPRRRLHAGVSLHEVWLRLEHQLLLKLPESGSVLFGIRVDVVPLAELAADRAATARFVRLLSTMHAAAAEYKALSAAIPALLRLLPSERVY